MIKIQNYGPKKVPIMHASPKFHPYSKMPSKVPNSKFWIRSAGSETWQAGSSLGRSRAFPLERSTTASLLGGCQETPENTKSKVWSQINWMRTKPARIIWEGSKAILAKSASGTPGEFVVDSWNVQQGPLLETTLQVVKGFEKTS